MVVKGVSERYNHIVEDQGEDGTEGLCSLLGPEAQMCLLQTHTLMVYRIERMI